MEVKIENMVFGWHEELPEMFIELLNTLKGCNGGVRPKGTFQCPFRLWVWRTPFMGDAEEGFRPRPMFGEQTTDC